MNIQYKDEIYNIFNNLQHTFLPHNSYTYFGSAAAEQFGEYINLYITTEQEMITKAEFAAIGSVMLIVAAETFCRLAAGKSFQDVLLFAELNSEYNKIATSHKELSMLSVLNAFYKVMENKAAYDTVR